MYDLSIILQSQWEAYNCVNNDCANYPGCVNKQGSNYPGSTVCDVSLDDLRVHSQCV